jgi:hypothetical protein
MEARFAELREATAVEFAALRKEMHAATSGREALIERRFSGR